MERAVTDEALFQARFVDDVRRCGAQRAPAFVAEIERRCALALHAPVQLRERRWARLVAAVSELLACVPEREIGAPARLRAFVRENADLDRPRDVAITDFHFDLRAERMLTTRDGRAIVAFARIPPAPARRVALDEVVPGPTRRLAEWAVYGLCGGAAAAAFWFAFIVPV